MIKVCFFVPSLNIGGIENVFITYANELANCGYNVSFLLCYREGTLLSLVSDKVKIEDLGNVQLRFSLFKLRKTIKKLKPDVLITGGDISNMMCVLATRFMSERPKVIISKHNYRNVETKDLGWWTRFDIILQKKLYPFADKIVAVSKGMSAYLQKELKIDNSQIVQLCNPLDIDGIEKKSQERIEVTLPSQYIIFVGRLGKVKNFKLLLDSYARLDDKTVHLVIVGEGPERAFIESYIVTNEIQTRVHLLGAMSNPMPLIKKAKALVLSSTSEAYPTILLESMALNVPIVATPTQGAIEILGDTEGTFISSNFNDVEDFKQLLNKALKYDKPISSKLVEANNKDIIIKRFIDNVISN